MIHLFHARSDTNTFPLCCPLLLPYLSLPLPSPFLSFSQGGMQIDNANNLYTCIYGGNVAKTVLGSSSGTMNAAWATGSGCQDCGLAIDPTFTWLYTTCASTINKVSLSGGGGMSSIGGSSYNYGQLDWGD